MSSDNEDVSARQKGSDAKIKPDTAATNDSKADHSDATETEEESSARVNAAKAFFRAMYAGDEVDAEQYGMNVGTVRSSNEKGLCSSCDNLYAQVGQLEARAAELEGLYKRMAADFENYRKRIEREKDELASTGVHKAVEAILPALDDLDRAKNSFNQNSEPAHVIESLKLIADRFNRCLEQIGVKQMHAVGKAFDPRLHEPVQQVIAPDLPDGSVANDLRRGYAMGDKVIRPALVNVVGNDLENTGAVNQAAHNVESPEDTEIDTVDISIEKKNDERNNSKENL